MDVVITYVNGLDKIWREEYDRHLNLPAQDKRFRDWGTLKYLLRGIQSNMPFVRNVFLVVSHKSQVPDWADVSNLKIVLHEEIIPKEYLPTFNSTTIEMFLHKIEGLDEEFIYFNDDMFPVGACDPEDFFADGKIVLGFSRHRLAWGMYKKHCRRSDNIARRVLGQRVGSDFIRPQHICSPMLKSQCDEIFNKANEDILASLTKVRENKNINQYIFLDYIYYKGLAIQKRISKKHISVSLASPGTLRSFIVNQKRKMVCINDVKVSEKRYSKLKPAILNAFQERFPDKSRFEL